MKTIEARDQVRLSVYQCFEICIHGVYYRLFRSMVTVSIVVLTVAFFSNVMIEGLMTNGVARGVEGELQAMRRDARFLAKLTEVETLEGIAERMADLATGSPAYLEVVGITGLDPTALNGLIAFSRQRREYQEFFDGDLTYGQRQILVKGRQGLAVFELLQDPEHRQALSDGLRQLKSVRMPTSTEAFDSFLGSFRANLEGVRALLGPYERTVQAVASRYALPELKSAIIAGDGELLEYLRSLGFVIPDAEYADIGRQLSETERILSMAQAFQNFTFKSRFITKFSILAKEYGDTLVMSKLRRRSGSEWFEKQVADLGLEVTLPTQQVRQLARAALARGTLREIERVLNTKGDWRRGIDTKTVWLMVVSFIVCTVGIANAMLMSVTERFREIATMKCLGALDGFVMVLFVMEAGLFGLAGGVLGVLLGMLLSLLKQFLGYGSYAFAYLPWAHVGVATLAALGAGMVIATVAALYPSWVASRMAPMEAMRVE